LNGPLYARAIFGEETETSVTVGAEETAHFAGCVIVIDR